MGQYHMSERHACRLMDLARSTHRYQARKAEREISAGHYRGPLHGIPYAPKDLLATKGIRTTDESRRAMEDMPADEYLALSYYERWVRSTEQLLVEKGVLSQAEIDRKMADLEATWAVS